MVEHAIVYSSYIEEADYARPGGNSGTDVGGQARGRIRESIAGALEESFQALGKSLAEARRLTKLLKFDRD